MMVHSVDMNNAELQRRIVAKLLDAVRIVAQSFTTVAVPARPHHIRARAQVVSFKLVTW
jgi:hypothetical protein